MASAGENIDEESSLGREDEEFCTIEASVVTGFEECARGEAKEKFGTDVKASRGKIIWKVPLNRLPEVLKMGSIDNCRVVMHTIPHFKFTDQNDSLARLQKMILDVDWESGLNAWRKLFDFPYLIASRPDVIPSPEDLVDVVVMTRLPQPKDKSEKKKKNQGKGKGRKKNKENKGGGEKEGGRESNSDEKREEANVAVAESLDRGDSVKDSAHGELLEEGATGVCEDGATSLVKSECGSGDAPDSTSAEKQEACGASNAPEKVPIVAPPKTVVIKKITSAELEPKIDIKVLGPDPTKNVFPTALENKELRHLEPMEVDSPNSSFRASHSSLQAERGEEDSSVSAGGSEAVKAEDNPENQAFPSNSEATVDISSVAAAFATSVISRLSTPPSSPARNIPGATGCATPPSTPIMSLENPFLSPMVGQNGHAAHPVIENGSTNDCGTSVDPVVCDQEVPIITPAVCDQEVPIITPASPPLAVVESPSAVSDPAVETSTDGCTTESNSKSSEEGDAHVENVEEVPVFPSPEKEGDIFVESPKKEQNPISKSPEKDTIMLTEKDTVESPEEDAIKSPPKDTIISPEKNTSLSPSPEKNAVKSPEKEPDPTKPKFRVTCNRVGEHPFDSSSAAASFGSAVITYFKWPVNLKKYDIEVLLNIDNEEVSVSLALTKTSLHNRNMVAFGPTTLRATICYNMLRLCRVKNGDFICDPMCGTSAIPIESALNWTNCYTFGGDFHEKAMERTVANIAAIQQKRWEVKKSHLKLDAVQWNIENFPLRDACVDVFVSDLPFGHRLGSRTVNRTLYPCLLSEMARTARPGARACLLTEDRTSLIKAIQSLCKFWQRRLVLSVNIGGLSGFVFVLIRTAASPKEETSPVVTPESLSPPGNTEGSPPTQDAAQTEVSTETESIGDATN